MSFSCRAKFKKFIQGGGNVLAALLSLCVLAPRAYGAEITERQDIEFGTAVTVTEETTYRGISSDDYGGVLSITKGFYRASAPVYFLDNSANDGGAVSYMNGTLNFLDIAVFERNSAVASQMDGTYGHGGAIYMTGGRAYFGKAATFNDNRAYYGGAIYSGAMNNTIEFNDKVTFNGNESFTKSEYKNSGRGGAIYNLGKITVDGDADFISNIADADGEGGGAIYNKGTFTVKGETLFQGNEAYYGQGGAIYNTETVKLGAADKKTTFKDNLGATGTVYNNGGGFYVEGDLYAVNNTSRINGGGFLNLRNGYGSIKGSALFENNKGSNGGAIYITNPGTFTFTGDAIFTGNKATSRTGNGGAIYNSGGTLYFRGSSYTFKDNTAKNGTVKNDIYNTGTIAVGYGSDSTTEFNASYIAGSGTVNIKGTVNLNAANDEKTIEWSNLLDIASNAVLNVNDVITLSGGVTDKGILVLTQSGGRAVFNKTATFKNNNFYHGGAIYAGEKSDGVEFVGDAIFESNRTYSQTDDSTSDIGGAIYNVSAGDFIIGGNATFKSNTATRGGGGIYNEGTFIIRGESLFYKNQSYSGNGGAIYNKGGSMTLGDVGKKTTFENNMGNNGIVFNTGDFTILGDVVSVNNQVRSNNGGFIDNRGTARVNGTSTLTDNTASGSGGAVSNKDGATLTLVGDADFLRNKANDYGGAVINEGVLTLCGNAVFEDNRLIYNDTQGGAIYNEGTINFQGASYTFANNLLKGGGFNDIFNDGGTLNIGVAGGTTDFSISYVTGRTATASAILFGTVNLKAANAAKTIDWLNNRVEVSDGSVLNIENTVLFQGVSRSDGTDGAAMFIGSGSKVTVAADAVATFNKNGAYQAGGAVYNKGVFTADGDVIFTNNKAIHDAGAVYNEGTFTVKGESVFRGNKSNYGHGTAIYNKGVVMLGAADKKTTFDANTGNDATVYNEGSLTISGELAATNNSISSATGGFLRNKGTAQINGYALIADNYASSSGGAIYNEGVNSKLTFLGNADFLRNRNTYHGGAISNEGALNFKGTSYTFKDNKSGASTFNDIYNSGTMNIGAAGQETDFKASYVTGIGYANIFGTVNLYAQNDEGTISWQNRINVENGAVLNVKDSISISNFDSTGGYASALYVADAGSKAVFDKSATFKSNRSYHGGAIYAGAQTGGVQIAGDAIFERNSATFKTGDSTSGLGGDATFKRNHADNGGAGIYNEGALVIKGASLFQENTSYNNGGAVYNRGVMTMGAADKKTTVNAQYGNYTAVENAGGTLTILGAFTATNNNASSGCGGALKNSGGTVRIDGFASFTGNKAGSSGGALYNENRYSKMTLAGGAEFLRNSSKYSGGALDNDGTLTIANAATFTENTSTSDRGGAVHNTKTINFNGTAVFEGNTVSGQDGKGGAVFNDKKGVLAFSRDASFTNNTAKNYGGAIYNAGTINFGSDAKRVRLTFEKNTAKEGGNAIFNTSGGVITIKGDAVFSGDPAVEASAKYGGAIRNYKADGASVGGRFITEGTAKFYDNKASWGGGALSNNTASLFSVSDGATFERNKAATAGGAIYNKGEVSFGGLAVFNGNTAATAGGAVYNYKESTFTAGAGATFASNTTDANGGAVYNDGSFTLNGVATFTGNTANGNGGAVYNYSSGTLFIHDATFKNNTAAAGGALYNLGTINFNGSSYKFENNKAGDSFSDIVNNGTINAGVSGAATSFDISFVSGRGSTDFKGDVTLNATQNDTIYWQQNAVRVLSGSSLNIGKNLLDAGGGDFTSEGTLKLTLSGLTNGSSDFTGGRLKTTGTATIGGTLFVTIDPSVSLTGQTDELLLAEAGTYTIADDLILKISDGYTISYVGDGKFVIGKQGGTPPDPGEDPDNPTPPDPTPRPAEPEDTRFVKPAKQVAIADVRAGVVQITDRLSTLGAPAAAMKGRSGGAAGGAEGEATLWAKALYTTTDLRGRTKMDSDGYGVIVGADGAAGRSLYLGAALGYTRNKGDTDLSHFKSETYLGYLYGRYALTQDVDVAGTAGYGFTRFDLNAADKKFNAHTINAQAIVSYALPAHLTAEIGGRYTFSMMDAYTTGSTEVAAEDTHTATASAGLRYRQNFGGFVLKASAGVLYDVYSDTADYRLTQSGVASFAKGERLHRFGGEGGVGFGYEGETFGIEADYNAQVRKDYNDQTVSVKVVYRFGGAQKAKKNTGAKVVVPGAAGTATTLREKSKQTSVKSQIAAPAAPVKRLQVSSFKKKKNARKQYRHLSKKYPELKEKKPDYKRVNVKEMGKRVRTYVKGEDEELHSLCKKMRKDLKDSCLISKNR